MPVSKESKNHRRHFLKVLGGAAVGACGGYLAGVAGTSCTVGGPMTLSNVPMNSLQAVSGESVAIGRDAGGLYALSTICTHQGCDIAQRGVVSSAGLQCGCHGAQYDANGAELSGPTQGPLEHYKVSVDSTGNITIDPSTVVRASIRTPVSAAV